MAPTCAETSDQHRETTGHAFRTQATQSGYELRSPVGKANKGPVVVPAFFESMQARFLVILDLMKLTGRLEERFFFSLGPY